MKKDLIIITGPTGVGKTDFANEVALRVHGELINADVGQLYVPLTIGTAKPDMATLPVSAHLFDRLSEPIDWNALDYRKEVLHWCAELWNAGKTPIIVGGSVFYIYSLFFPPTTSKIDQACILNSDISWQALNEVDPERAAAIHPHDRYRIERALSLYYATNSRPSSHKPAFDLFFDRLFFIYLDRQREDLYARINERTGVMLNEGWIEEVASLPHAWHIFLKEKKIIGYDDILMCLDGALDRQSLESVIAQKTRNYAKRQRSFLRRMIRHLEEARLQYNFSGSLSHVDCSQENLSLYIDRLLVMIKGL